MKCMAVFTIAAVAFAGLADNAFAQRRGAASGGVRGAVVGGMVGGSEGAEKGAKIGVVAGATRTVMDREGQSRAEYQSSAEYNKAQHSDFNEVPVDVLGTPESGTAAEPGGKAIISKDGKPIAGITYPSDWKQKNDTMRVAAVSADGHAFSVLASLEGVDSNAAGIENVKARLNGSLKDVTYDDPTETKGGATVITGTGKGKKSGIDVVFAVGVFDAGDGQFVGTGFVVDSKIEGHYKETIKGICQTILRTKDLAAPASTVKAKAKSE
jgi:hypothetical protein